MPTSLPTNRTTASSAADHVTDHNTVHGHTNTIGSMGYAQVTASQGTFTAITDLTSLTVTVTVVSGQRIKITGYAAFSTSAGNDRVDLWIYEGSTALTRATVASPSTTANSVYVQAVAVAILTPSAGSHTYKLRAERGSGTGNVTMFAAATHPAFILVEGIGT